MTERTIRPQTALMMAVPVAGAATQRRAFEQLRAMAVLARHHGMASNQRKSSNVVIEGRYPAPTGLRVTLLAAIAKVAFVSIVLSVTRHTIGRQFVAIEIPGMATVALDPRMRTSQRVFRRLVMVKANRAPLARIVAGFALGAVPSGVNILNPVAIDALGTDPFVAFPDMAP